MRREEYVVKCCICKRIQTERGWQNEFREKGIDGRTVAYTHGYCPDCYRTALARMKALYDDVLRVAS